VNVDDLLFGEAAVKRRAIAKAITLLSSTRSDHQVHADKLLITLMPLIEVAAFQRLHNLPCIANPLQGSK
jgi:putative protein kinase ArgK-like GTPase of G3E family